MKLMARIALYHLETLLWIARLGTFQAAAERLNITQPAISTRVREIEDQLGIKLFKKEGRRMALTSRGRLLVKECEPFWAGIEETLLNVSDFKMARGNVRVGSGEIAAASCLPGFIREVERDLVGVTLEVEIDLTALMLQQLVVGVTDMVFLAGPVATPGIQTARIGSVGLVWTASAATVRAGAFDQALPVWSLPSHSPLHGITLETLRATGTRYRSINTCNNVRTLMGIVIVGHGAAILPETMVRKELRQGALVEILPRPTRKIEFEVAIRRNEQDPVVLELFRRAAKLMIDPVPGGGRLQN